MENIYRIIRSIIASKPWSAEEAVESFEHKIGLCGDNGYESIYFPENQDDYGIEVEGWTRIEPGMVELTYWGGEEKIIYLEQGDYKNLLIRYLSEERMDQSIIERVKKIVPGKCTSM